MWTWKRRAASPPNFTSPPGDHQTQQSLRNAEQDNLLNAYLKAYACDPVSAFGGVLAFNRTVDAATAEEVGKLFVECIAAPDSILAPERYFPRRKISAAGASRCRIRTGTNCN